MSLILDEAKEHLTEVTDSEKQLQHTRKLQIQSEIGQDTYAAAKQALPAMEAFIRGTVLPWRESLEALAQAGAKLSPPKHLGTVVRIWLRELDSMQGIPASLARGIHAFETFTVPLWAANTRFEDINARVVLINGIRAELRCHENAQPRMEILIGQIESWLKDNGWTQDPDQQATA